MSKTSFKPQKFVHITLCVIALIGFFLPAIRTEIELSILGVSRIENFSIARIFDGSNEPLLDFGESQFSDILENSDIMEDMGGRIVFSVAAYFGTLLLLMLFLLLTSLGKLRLRRIKLIIPPLAFILYIMGGRTIQTVSDIIVESLTNTLGFFALFIDLSRMFGIYFGSGYWLTLTALAVIGITEIGMYLWQGVKTQVW